MPDEQGGWKLRYREHKLKGGGRAAVVSFDRKGGFLGRSDKIPQGKVFAVEATTGYPVLADRGEESGQPGFEIRGWRLYHGTLDPDRDWEAWEEGVRETFVFCREPVRDMSVATGPPPEFEAVLQDSGLPVFRRKGHPLGASSSSS